MDSDILLHPEEGSLIHFTRKLHGKVNKESKLDGNEPPAKTIDMLKRHQKRTFSRDDYHYCYPYIRSHQQDKYALLDITDHAKAEDEAEKHCSKIFYLKKLPDSSHISWNLPPPDSLYLHHAWKNEALQVMKEELNAVKGQLEEYDIEEWHKHTHNVNPAVNIPNMVRSRAKPELLTQAFLKLYEILHSFAITPEEIPEEAEFRSLHLCEAPGAFVVALNHFLGVNKPEIWGKWSWRANTLNPYYEGTPASECISDDRFILHTLSSWYFGNDQTGNLMSPRYLEELKGLYQDLKNKAQLVTADGSIDCQGNPAEQETMTHSLHFCETYACLSVLAPGGSFVLKKFTFYEAESVCLLYFLCCAFDEVAVCKPITSKMGNSEVYIVAMGYKYTSAIQEYLTALRQFYGCQQSTTMFSTDQIPTDFIALITECAEFFRNFQVDAIKRNIELLESNGDKQKQYADLLKALLVQRFCDNNTCKPLNQSQKLIPHQKLTWDKYIYPQISLKWGEQIMKRSKPERMKFLNSQYESLVSAQSSILGSKTKHFEFFVNEVQINYGFKVKFDIIIGKPFDLVYTSRFCNASVMRVYIHYLKECSRSMEYGQLNKLLLDAQKIEVFQNTTREVFVALTKSEQIYPEAMILHEGSFVGPHDRCLSLEKLLLLMGRCGLKPGDNVILFYSLLLTRYQSGLFHALCSAFQNIIFYFISPEEDKFLQLPPFIVLTNFRSEEAGKAIYDQLQQKGWSEGSAARGFHEIISIKNLVNSPLYRHICQYNTLLCLWNINALRQTQIHASA